MFDALTDIAASFRAQNIAEHPDTRIEEDFAALQRGIERLEVERLRRLAEIERRGLHERDGHLSAVSWLASTHSMSRGAAVGEVRVARALNEMPVALEALDEGRVSLGAVSLLARARQVDPDAFARAESVLVEAARVHPVGELERVLGHWRHRVESERLETDTIRDGRRLHASVTFGGMVRIDGDLDPDTGESLLTALRAVMDSEARLEDDDRRSPAQRRADALGEICRGWLDGAERPSIAGDKPHVTVTVDVKELVGGGTGELEHAGPIATAALRRLACDASVVRVVMAGRSQPLDVGRRTPVVPPAMRRALIVRDAGCRFPGCERPHSWCDAHHVVHWADGGPTAISNLVLLCRRHHRAIHEGFRVEMVAGQPEFFRPDGSALAKRAPPAIAA
jgi:Domain of unknown function (DUF222)/HNH endonuclease